jgi:2,4-dienoyl-CoA reductase-like NADH-dependent reductase (Old Yellow Enzyme family)
MAMTMTNVSLTSPLRIGTLSLRNRLYRAPVLEGAGNAKDPAAEYARHFVPNARAGVGLIVQGNTIVTPEGRTSPGMSAIAERDQMLALRKVTDGVHGAGGRIVIQLGHGGIFALESWHRDFIAKSKSLPWAPSALPWWLRLFHRGVHVLTTAEVEALVARFGVVASWAREAGYDGVQLAASNAKLLHQFLSPTFNRRRDRFGGNLEGRFRLFQEIREAIGREAGWDFPVLLKVAAVEQRVLGRGLTLEDGVRLAQLAESAGYAAITPVFADVFPNTSICRGDFPRESFDSNLGPKLEKVSGRLFAWGTRINMMRTSRRYPFESVWNRPIFSAIKAAVKIPVLAVGGIRTPAEANAIIARGEADLVGVGRPFYAEPDLAARFLATNEATAHQGTACQSCNRCMLPQMLGMPGICYNPEVNRARRGKGKTEVLAEAA